MRRAVAGAAAVLACLGVSVGSAATPKPPRAPTTAFVFFNSMCSGCGPELREVNQWLAARPSLRPVGVAYRQRVDQAKDFARTYGFEGPIVGDPQARLARKLGVHVLVKVVLVRNGRIVGRYAPPYPSQA